MNWKKHYEFCRDYFIKNISKSAPIVTGFNANLDAIRYVDEELIKNLGRNYSKRKSVKSIQDLGRGLMESIELGEANEWELENNDLYPEILELGYDEIRMGGQAGIVSNLMARMGLEVRILLPVLSEDLAKKFVSKNIKTPLLVNNKLSIKSVKKNFDKEANARVNAIFEFKKGFMSAERSNRFILSYRHKGHKPILNERIVLNSRKIFDRVRRAFFSGYQLLEYGTDFRRAGDQLSYMKRFAPGTKFHLELTNVEDSKQRKKILGIAKNYDSVGCNDVELELFSGTDQIFKGMKKIVNFASLERLHVHTPSNHYCLVHKDYEISPEKVRSSMMMGSYLGAAKAFTQQIKSRKSLENVPASISSEGKDYLRKIESDSGIIRMKNYTMVIIPTMYSKKIKSTVGLGDSISSTAFVSETI